MVDGSVSGWVNLEAGATSVRHPPPPPSIATLVGLADRLKRG